MADTSLQAALRAAFNSKLSVIAQTLTPEQQQQARNNIGALPANDLSNQIKEAVLSIFFPVGSIYVSANDTFDPNAQWGGTWTKIEDCFLLGSGSRNIGSTGGEENVTLTQSQMPSHTHSRGTMNFYGEGLVEGGELGSVAKSGVLTVASGRSGTYMYFGGSSYVGNTNVMAIQGSQNWTGVSGTSGGSQAHNNMPPYQVVAIWKRTA